MREGVSAMSTRPPRSADRRLIAAFSGQEVRLGADRLRGIETSFAMQQQMGLYDATLSSNSKVAWYITYGSVYSWKRVSDMQQRS